MNRKRISTRIGLLIGIGLAGTSLVMAPAAMAYGPSYCNSSTCILSGSPSTAQIFFNMPRLTPVTMTCWTDNQWWNGTNRWFRVNSIYGTGYMNANQVSSQTWTPHC